MKRALVALILVAACRDAKAPPPRRSVVDIPKDAGPPAISVKERVDDALKRSDPPRFVRAHLVATPNLTTPIAPAVHTQVKGRILISDEVWPQRMLLDAGLDQPLESEMRGRAVVAKCFAHAGRSERTSVTIELDEPASRIVEKPETPFGRCFAETLVATFSPPLPWKVRVDFTLRMAQSSGVYPETFAEALADLTELALRPHSARALVLGGIRSIDAALLDPEHRDRLHSTARGWFKSSLAVPSAGPPLDPDNQARTLFGLALVESKEAHELRDSNRALRGLLCPSQFPYSATTPPVLAVDQDHDATYWRAWEKLHPTPDAKDPKKGLPIPNGPKTFDEEMKYRSPYAGCTPLPDARADVVAESWQRLSALAEFDQAAGPYRFHRAIEAQRAALAVQPTKHAKLRLATLLLRRQSFVEARTVLAELLRELDPKTEDDLLLRAAQLYGSSVTYSSEPDLPPDAPFIERPDLLDTEVNPEKASAKLGAIVLKRLEEVKEPLVWRAAAEELRVAAIYRAAVAVDRTLLERFPLHRDAPLVQKEEIEVLETIAKTMRPNTPEAAQAAKAVADAKPKMKSYVGTTPWTKANESDREALERAAKLAADAP